MAQVDERVELHPLPFAPHRQRARGQRRAGTAGVQASWPCRGRTASDVARPSATARRAGLIEPQSRLGCTRLVSRIAIDRDARSITSVVPV